MSRFFGINSATAFPYPWRIFQLWQNTEYTWVYNIIMKLLNSFMEFAKTSFADCTYKNVYCVYVLLVVKLVYHCTIFMPGWAVWWYRDLHDNKNMCHLYSAKSIKNPFPLKFWLHQSCFMVPLYLLKLDFLFANIKNSIVCVCVTFVCNCIVYTWKFFMPDKYVWWCLIMSLIFHIVKL